MGGTEFMIEKSNPCFGPLLEECLWEMRNPQGYFAMGWYEYVKVVHPGRRQLLWFDFVPRWPDGVLGFSEISSGVWRSEDRERSRWVLRENAARSAEEISKCERNKYGLFELEPRDHWHARMWWTLC